MFNQFFRSNDFISLTETIKLEGNFYDVFADEMDQVEKKQKKQSTSQLNMASNLPSSPKQQSQQRKPVAEPINLLSASVAGIIKKKPASLTPLSPGKKAVNDLENAIAKVNF